MAHKSGECTYIRFPDRWSLSAFAGSLIRFWHTKNWFYSICDLLYKLLGRLQIVVVWRPMALAQKEKPKHSAGYRLLTLTPLFDYEYRFSYQHYAFSQWRKLRASIYLANAKMTNMIYVPFVILALLKWIQGNGCLKYHLMDTTHVKCCRICVRGALMKSTIEYRMKMPTRSLCPFSRMYELMNNSVGFDRVNAKAGQNFIEFALILLRRSDRWTSTYLTPEKC